MSEVSVDSEAHRKIFNHFTQRFGERFGKGVSALVLWRGLVHTFAIQDWGLLHPIARVSRCGRRIFMIRLSDGRACFVLFDCKAGLPLTVFTEGMVVTRQGRSPIRLGVPYGLR